MKLNLVLTMQNKDFRKTFGARRKELRKHKRWSQKELAAKVGIRFQQLNKYESGLNLPPPLRCCSSWQMRWRWPRPLITC
jgi:DNA-binding XRE family transcriptional regulator